jgi:CDP-glucose 4,6-dehydratase
VDARHGALENLVSPHVHSAFWKDRRVLVTGHSGFKGSWLTLWLREVGARTTGYSLAVPPSRPDLFGLAELAQDCELDARGDIGDGAALRAAFAKAKPEIVFHLAAQPLVRASYRDPAETWRVNVQGTLAVLEACRDCDSVKTIVVITTDKVYENPESGHPFREDDPLGGYDPYSASKAACEILCASWRRSFLATSADSGRQDGRIVGLATARAGNVIGGGDFAEDRLVPDLVRARISGSTTSLRYPDAVRPWQHVLEPLAGYLMLAEKLHADPAAFSTAFNFGPDKSDFRPVRDVADGICATLGSRWEHQQSPQPHEAGLLRLDSTRAETLLGWKPRLPFAETLRWTADWYARWHGGASEKNARALTLEQIRAYQSLLKP